MIKILTKHFNKKMNKLEESELNSLRKNLFVFENINIRNKIINKLNFHFSIGDIVVYQKRIILFVWYL